MATPHYQRRCDQTAADGFEKPHQSGAAKKESASCGYWPNPARPAAACHCLAAPLPTTGAAMWFYLLQSGRLQREIRPGAHERLARANQHDHWDSAWLLVQNESSAILCGKQRI